MKKLISLVLALAMILVVGAAFATEEPPTGGEEGETTGNKIEITNAAIGETYKAYKMLDLSYSDEDGDGEPDAYAYTVNSAWAGFFNAENSVVTDVFTFEGQYVTSLTPNETSWTLAEFPSAHSLYFIN